MSSQIHQPDIPMKTNKLAPLFTILLLVLLCSCKKDVPDSRESISSSETPNSSAIYLKYVKDSLQSVIDSTNSNIFSVLLHSTDSAIIVLDSIPDVNQVRNYLGSPIFIEAIKEDNITLIEYLIIRGVSLTNGNPLFTAITSFTQESITLLLKNGAPTNNINSTGHSALHTAMRIEQGEQRVFDISGSPEILSIILEYHKDSIVTADIWTAFESNNSLIIDLIFKHGANPNVDGYPFIELTKRGYIKTLEQVIPQITDINALDSLGKPAIYYASTEKIYTLLKESGANTNLSPIDQLSMHSRLGHYYRVMELLEDGVNPNSNPNEYSGPLYLAIKSKCAETVGALLSYKADMPGNELKVAVQYGTSDIVDTLMQYNLYNYQEAIDQSTYFMSESAGGDAQLGLRILQNLDSHSVKSINFDVNSACESDHAIIIEALKKGMVLPIEEIPTSLSYNNCVWVLFEKLKEDSGSALYTKGLLGK